MTTTVQEKMEQEHLKENHGSISVGGLRARHRLSELARSLRFGAKKHVGQFYGPVQKVLRPGVVPYINVVRNKQLHHTPVHHDPVLFWPV
jgi:hypothetical protein